MDMFSELNDFLEENEFSQNIVKQSTISHLYNLSQWFDKYFPEDTTPQQYDWILSPFTVSNTHHLSSDMIEALDDLSSDRGLKIAFDTKRTLAEFWISVAKEYPQLSAAAMNVLLPFGTTYLCERTFSALSYIKSKYRSRLEVEDDLRIAVSQIKPRIDLLCSQHRAHSSH
ncbi:SCAN domain-containing protein 3-like [Ciona intestinalis]